MNIQNSGCSHAEHVIKILAV
uniref:Uncharacterized protein n=1 Tax=Anguilla anguilla TaxID=7936 RepID=A0A0E9XBD1_ANGAN